MSARRQIPRDKWAWTDERIERLRQLAQCGADVDAILNDPLLSATSPQSIRNMCSRLKLKLRQGLPVCTLQLRLTPEQAAELEHMARERGVAPGVLATRLVGVAIDDALVNAVLDDRDDAPAHNKTEAPVATPANGSETAQCEADEIKRLMAGGMDVFDAMRLVAQKDNRGTV